MCACVGTGSGYTGGGTRQPPGRHKHDRPGARAQLAAASSGNTDRRPAQADEHQAILITSQGCWHPGAGMASLGGFFKGSPELSSQILYLFPVLPVLWFQFGEMYPA